MASGKLEIESAADKFAKKPPLKTNRGISDTNKVDKIAIMVSLNFLSAIKSNKKTDGKGFMAMANDRKTALKINFSFIKKNINSARNMDRIPSKLPLSISNRNGKVKSDRMKTFVQFVG